MPKANSKSTKRPARPSRLGGAPIQRRLAQREAWLRQIAPTSLFHVLFDHLPAILTRSVRTTIPRAAK
ncbi:MAG: hypothetical protein NTY01_11245 [Verrucomicrobia bacterium]|nr:hypothetical protein [Verrucomicrobiota bacterium]